MPSGRHEGMIDKCDKDLPPEDLKATVNRQCHVSFFACVAETCSTIKCYSFYISYLCRSRSGARSRSLEQRNHDSAPLLEAILKTDNERSATCNPSAPARGASQRAAE